MRRHDASVERRLRKSIACPRRTGFRAALNQTADDYRLVEDFRSRASVRCQQPPQTGFRQSPSNQTPGGLFVPGCTSRSSPRHENVRSGTLLLSSVRQNFIKHFLRSSDKLPVEQSGILTTSPVAPMLFFPRRAHVVTIRISRAERCTSEHLSPNTGRSSSFGAVIYRTCLFPIVSAGHLSVSNCVSPVIY